MKQSDFIPGIYNYCDTWCERCLLTARCSSFQTQRQQEDGVTPTTATNTGEVLVQQLTEALNMTKQYLEKLRVQGDFPDDTGPTEDEKRRLEEQAAFRRQQAKNHPIAQISHHYMRSSGEWIRQEANLLEEAGNHQAQAVELGIREHEEALDQLNALKDAWEMIKWYRTLIPVKAMSALRVLTDPIDPSNRPDPYLNDYYLGKAKLVLVCIDRSLMAWQTMLATYPEKTDDTLDALAMLSRMRREMETLFPQARAFRRPGLD